MRKLHDKELGQFMFQMPSTEILRKDTDIAKPFMLMALRPHNRDELMVMIFGKENHYFAYKISGGIPAFSIPKAKIVSQELFQDSYIFNACASLLGCDIQMYLRLHNNMQLIRKYIAVKHALKLSEADIESTKRQFKGKILVRVLSMENAHLKGLKQLVSTHKSKCIDLFGQKIEFNTNCTNIEKAEKDSITESLILSAKKSRFEGVAGVIEYLSHCSPYQRDYSELLQLTSP